MVFQKYYEELVFNVINIANYNIILRILWLKKCDPQINWKQKILIMEYEYIFNSEPHHQLNMIRDERRSRKIQLKKVTIFNLNQEH